MASFTVAQTERRIFLRNADGVPYYVLGLNHTGAVSSPGRYSDTFRGLYGGDWEHFGAAAYTQLLQWGFNCCGYGAPASLQRRLPFFASIQVTHNSQWLPRDEFCYDDVFDGAFRDRVESEVRKTVGEVGRQQNLIGYYWNDMPQWDIHVARRQRETDWISFLRALPERAPGRERYLEFLSRTYGTVDELNAAYGLNLRSHDEICRTPPTSLWSSDKACEDDYEFLAIIARELYRVMHEAVRGHDDAHLIFGERYWLSDAPACVLKEALPYVDVLSIQYGPEASPLPGDGYERVFDRPRTDALYGEHEKPVIICDHNISFATDEHQRTLWHRAPTRAQGADLYRAFLMGVVDAPYIVGYCKCQYISRHSQCRDLLKQGLLAEDGSPYEPYASMIGSANREAMVRFCMQT
jgi:agarase